MKANEFIENHGLSEARKAFELWAVKEELDITSVDFSSGSIRATDKHGNRIQFCYEETETATAWDVWQEQQKKIDVLQQEHAELLAFNENLDRERNMHRDQAGKYRKKVEMIASLFVVPGDDHELTLKAIKAIIDTVGEQ
ncbi:hypothetical protein [Acinetobacter boissieri]|uniref:Uncharacterized protein n=1 Tax=Acinetobacter boissieri TaxID=1219383 RepID=A0A1G6KBN3_9GAMM|nr:hypothetical protein [Acinetobacter boissieri]SDC28482.1 hypothetical protein SAMN05421733_1163 [Acinetobacter boissieri]